MKLEPEVQKEGDIPGKDQGQPEQGVQVSWSSTTRIDLASWVMQCAKDLEATQDGTLQCIVMSHQTWRGMGGTNEHGIWESLVLEISPLVRVPVFLSPWVQYGLAQIYRKGRPVEVVRLKQGKESMR